MHKVQILSIGKNKKEWQSQAIADYEKRLHNRISFEWKFYKNRENLSLALDKFPKYICLHEHGRQFDSVHFSKFFFDFLTANQPAAFIIGDAAGIEKNVLENSYLNFSLSPLTFPHQIVRLLLIEQIYRAAEIQRNTNYHK